MPAFAACAGCRVSCDACLRRRHRWFMVARIGPLATISCEPGQARKGAAAAVDLGAGVWLVRVATLISAGWYNARIAVRDRSLSRNVGWHRIGDELPGPGA
jgi:hypothetical protein